MPFLYYKGGGGGTPKVMKIVKFFVVFNLILSISLINSVAAISVSDGSAFVTKAEFAADLNNLSNRMSTLENSLDAKIDSLVSSYLSRNGIWNGEKQEILSFKDEAIWVNRWCTRSDTDQTIYNDFFNVCRTNKTGLLNFRFKLTGANARGMSKTNFGTLMFVKYIYTNSSEAAKGIISVSYQIAYNNSISDILIYDKMFYNHIFTTDTTRHASVAMLPTYSFNDFFFVPKDVDLKMRLVVITEGGNWSSSFIERDTTSGVYLNPKLKIDSVMIY